MEKNDIEALAVLLEDAGYDYPQELIEEVLIPKAIKESVSLREAMLRYSNSDEKTDIKHFLLRIALGQIPISDLNKLNIGEILTEKTILT